MIGVEEAKRIMMEHLRPLPFTPMVLDLARDHHLAADVKSRAPHPMFDMSAVDGYALCGEGPEWMPVASIAAGQTMETELLPGDCARIFTGAQVPVGTERVVMQERAVRESSMIQCLGDLPPIGANIRSKGEQFTEGELLARTGERLGPASVGLIASGGIEEVEVSFKPWVAVVRTGNEFIEEGSPRDGRIFSSNEWMLFAALRKELCEVDDGGAFIANDDDADITTAIKQAAEADVVLTTGGVSVGDHDRVEAVLKNMGAEIHFHGVAQKPGKPMLFATLNGKPVFGLPGNPRAVMVLFWEYVLPFLRAMQGAPDPWPRTDHVPIVHPVAAKGDRAEFRAARLEGGKVRLLADEGSHMLRSLIDADVLVYLPANTRSWNEGELMEVHYLPR
jgi:molybdopterin molybdotransferase